MPPNIETPTCLQDKAIGSRIRGVLNDFTKIVRWRIGHQSFWGLGEREKASRLKIGRTTLKNALVSGTMSLPTAIHLAGQLRLTNELTHLLTCQIDDCAPPHGDEALPLSVLNDPKYANHETWIKSEQEIEDTLAKYKSTRLPTYSLNEIMMDLVPGLPNYRPLKPTPEQETPEQASTTKLIEDYRPTPLTPTPPMPPTLLPHEIAAQTPHQTFSSQCAYENDPYLNANHPDAPLPEGHETYIDETMPPNTNINTLI